MERLLILAAVVALTGLASLIYRALQGRVQAAAPAEPSDPVRRLLASADIQPDGATTTLLEVTAPGCASCVPARRMLDRVAADHDGVVVAEIDVTDLDADILRDLKLMRAPTTLILATDGTLLGRVGGVPRADELRELLLQRNERPPTAACAA